MNLLLGPYPVFRVLNEDGTYRSSTVGPSHVPPNLLTPPEQEEAFRLMTRLQQMDSIFLNAQRQGRISFYMSSTGEEATHIGSSLPMTLDDCILAQYRETGVLMHRGFTLQQFADQCFSNSSDLGKGRQMPVHYGSKALNFHTISSPLTTQLPQAVGASYFQKVRVLKSGLGGWVVCVGRLTVPRARAKKTRSPPLSHCHTVSHCGWWLFVPR